MKAGISALILFAGLSFSVAAQDKKLPSALTAGMTFREFASAAQNLLRVRIYYREEWVKDIRTGNYSEDFTLSRILDSLFSGKRLFYFTDRSGNIVVTKDFMVKRIGEVSVADTGVTAPSFAEEPAQDHQVKGNQFILIGNPAERNKPGKGNISGYITNSATHEPVAGASVVEKLLSAGTISNEFGFYSLPLPKGIHIINFSFMGMKEKSANIDLAGTGELNMEMTGVLIPLKETVVSAQKNVVLQRFEAGVEKIDLTSFRLTPTAMGEADIIKGVLLVPGVKSVGEGSAGFNVRGGSADQNLVLLYDAPIYNTSHFFGFFSAVNPDVISDATLYKGGIPGRFGGRISSVLDIKAKEGNMDKFRGNAGISPITAHAMVEGPIKKDTLSYLLAARTTYSNWIFNILDYSSFQRIRASFYDINAGLTWNAGKKDKLEFSSYMSHDAFRLGADSVYRYTNNIQSLRWRHFFSSRFFSTLSANNSYYKYSISNESKTPGSFVLSHQVNSTGLRSDFNWFQGRNEVNFGADLTYYSIHPGSYLPTNESSLVTPHVMPRERALESAVYAEDKFTVTSFFAVNLGVRISSFLTFGPGEAMVYKPGFSKSRSTITDTLTFANGQISSHYGGPEIRLSMNLRTSPVTSVKLNYNRTRQYIHLLSNSTSISPTDTWKLSDYNIKPQTGDQVAAGFYRMWFGNKVESSVEVYYKTINNMADFKGGANMVMNENIIEEMVNVKGKAYGLELALRKQEGKLRFTLGYSYSRTFIRSISSLKEEIINDGKWFPANFDKPNDLSLTVNYLFSRRLSFSADYTYNTGRPITYPVATYHMYDYILIHYSDRNKYRIPDYSRLDLSFRVGGSLRVHKIANPSWTFSVYNLLGRRNVYSVYFRKNGDEIKGYKLSVFGQAIPSVTFGFDF